MCEHLLANQSQIEELSVSAEQVRYLSHQMDHHRKDKGWLDG